MENKISKEKIKEMHKLKSQGLGFTSIAQKVGLNVWQVRYAILPTERETKNKRARERYKQNKGLWKDKNRKWREANPEKYKRSICLSLVKSNLEKGIITKENLQEIIKNLDEGK
jgi:hypothetical protein